MWPGEDDKAKIISLRQSGFVVEFFPCQSQYHDCLEGVELLMGFQDVVFLPSRANFKKTFLKVVVEV